MPSAIHYRPPKTRKVELRAGGAEARFTGQVAGWLWFTIGLASPPRSLREAAHGRKVCAPCRRKQLFAALLPIASAASAAVARVGSIGRLLGANIVAKSAAVEVAGRVSTVLLDKIGTITFGNRQASAFLPLPGVGKADLAEAALLASLGDQTLEGRSIVALAEAALSKVNLKERVATPIPFSGETRLSGARLVGGGEV